MTTRAAIVAEARTRRGDKWIHQACVKGFACDCIGLVGGVGVELGLPEALAWMNDPEFKAYGRPPNPRVLLRGVNKYLDEIKPNDVGLGDIPLMRFEIDPQHFAIVSRLDPTYIIHASNSFGRVVENRVDEQWRKRIIRAYRFRGIE